MAGIKVNEERCKGCGLCVGACPKQILALSKDRINAKGYHPVEMIDKDKCTGCTSCAIMCPDVVITVER
ncbi:MAG: 4Fe-4S dicluster domain-containing protein [Lachnospiraceae bacterium]|nr:4Fe-4S dicluster domain-containing protein [Lachnospiraceae bacterium]